VKDQPAVARVPDSGRPAPQADIWIGDVIRVWEVLDVTPAERAIVAEVLGHAYTPPEPRSSEVDDRATHSLQSGPPSSTTGSAVTTVVTSAAPSPSPSALEIPLKRTAHRTAARSADRPAWMKVAPLEPEQLADLDARPPYRPLFTPGWTRALVAHACATATSDGAYDVPWLVKRIARCQPVTDVPREEHLSVRRGMQLLVDVGENLEPFVGDVRALVSDLVAVIGRDRSRVLYFADCPSLGVGPGGRSTWLTPYVPPAIDTPIVIITDLGVARGAAQRWGASEGTWLAFLAMAAAKGCPVIVFNPYPIGRWPASLRDRIRPVHWDRTTNAADAHRTAREHASRD
jgi:hypothetical protein